MLPTCKLFYSPLPFSLLYLFIQPANLSHREKIDRFSFLSNIRFEILKKLRVHLRLDNETWLQPRSVNLFNFFFQFNYFHSPVGGEIKFETVVV